MTKHVTRRLLGGLGAALLAGLGAGTAPARAQSADSYPSRPVTLVVPFAAGVTADILLRGMAEVAGRHLGQPIHDAFKKAYEDPTVEALYGKVQFSRRYADSTAYTEMAKKLFEAERSFIEKLGLARK